MKHSAIILAGGKSSRMNYVDKAFLDVYGMPMIKHVLNKFDGIDDIVIVTNKPEDYKQLGVRVVTDIIPQRGPLSGMHSGLVHAKHDYSFITACDTPLVPKEFIDYCFSLEKDYDVAVPYWNGFYEPTCGMYSKAAIDEIVKAIKQIATEVKDNKLSCQLYQRSADAFLGVPFNIASYSISSSFALDIVVT